MFFLTCDSVADVDRGKVATIEGEHVKRVGLLIVNSHYIEVINKNVLLLFVFCYLWVSSIQGSRFFLFLRNLALEEDKRSMKSFHI